MINENKNILVTGGAGFIGTNIVNELRSRGYNVFICDLLNHELKMKKRWQNLTRSIITGKPVKKEPGRRNAKEARVFIEAMANIGEKSAKMFVKNIRFNGNERLLDLGGGPGKYIKELAETYPGMRLCLFEQPHTVAAAKKNLRGDSKSGLTRCYRYYAGRNYRMGGCRFARMHLS